MFVLWGLCAYIAYTAKSNGDMNVVLHPFDYNGTACGTSLMKDRPYLYPLRADGTGVCVDHCPTTTNSSVIYACVGAGYMPSYLVGSTDVKGLVNGMLGYCMFQMQTFELHNYCFVDDPQYVGLFPASSAAGALGKSHTTLIHLWYARAYILGFGASTILIYYFFVVFLHWSKTANVMIWTANILVTVTLFYFGVTSLIQSSQSSTSDTGLSLTAGVLSILIGCAWIGWAWYIRASIDLSTELIREAACALTDMPSLFLLPVLQGAIWCAFFAGWFVSVLWVTCVGDWVKQDFPNDPLSHKVYTQNKGNSSEIGFLIFVLVWTTLLIMTVTDLVVSHAIARWYFTRDKTKQSCCVVPGSFFTMLFYHFGTAAVGAVFVTIVYPFRDVLMWIDKKMRVCCGNAHQVLYCCLCFGLFMTQHFFRFWSKHAYVITALFSQEFFLSAKMSFFLIERNLTRASVVFAVCEYMVIILVLSVSLTPTMLFHIVAKNAPDLSVQDMVVPTAFTFALCFLLSTMCVEILGMAARSILLCFFADSEMFRPADRYVDPSLVEFMRKEDFIAEAAMHTAEDEHNKLMEPGQSKEYGSAAATAI